MQLPPTLTLEQAAAVWEALRVQGADGTGAGTGTWAVDASQLRVFDSSALALLLQAKRLAQAAGRAFEVQAAPAALRQLAQLYGVDELLGLAG